LKRKGECYTIGPAGTALPHTGFTEDLSIFRKTEFYFRNKENELIGRQWLKIIFLVVFMIIFIMIAPGTAFARGGQDTGKQDSCGRDYNDPNYKDECPSSSSDEQRKVEEAERILNHTLRAYNGTEGMNEEIRTQVWRNVEQAQRDLETARNELVRSQQTGDPVLVTTGKYLLEEDDFVIGGSSFSIRRKYISEGTVIGGSGSGWLSSLDSRIIRGVTVIDGGRLEEIEECIREIKGSYDLIMQELTEGVDGEELSEPDGGINETVEGGSGYRRAAEIARQIYNEMYLPALRHLGELRAIEARGEALRALNRYSRFAGTPADYEETGNGNLTLIDEGGSPKAFEPTDAGVWIPIAYPERLYERLESRDGRGAESTAGFVFYGRGGVTKEYDGNGFLVKITELNGNAVEITRNGEGKITRIRRPHGAEYGVTYTGNLIAGISGPEGTVTRYGYIGNLLSWVQDTDGDTVRYAYENGRLKEIIKPDNSAVKLTYGYTGAGGVQLVTATAHEEGASERFDYNLGQRVTVYTNHSGVQTRYRYDEKHRTIEETGSDGSIKAYGYNSMDQLQWERVNGFEIRYGYDGRGNIAEKAYSDEIRERREWNNNDQVTRYTDRDGVVTEWKYDGRGNCVEIYRGGVRIFSGSYDSKNRLTASREGDRTEIRYEYNSRDYISVRAVIINGQEIRELWEYDGLGRITKYTDGIGREWKYTYLTGETIEETPTRLQRRYIYNNRKDLVRVIERDLKTGEVRELNIEYDKRHLPLTVTDGAGNTIRNEYTVRTEK